MITQTHSHLYNKALEQKVLGVIISYPQALQRALPFLKSEMFYFSNHQKYFYAIEKINSEELIIDRTVLLAELQKDPDFNNQEEYDLSYLLGLECRATFCTDIERRCLILTQYYFTREVKKVGEKLYIDSDSEDSIELLEQAQKKIQELWSILTKHQTVTIGDRAREMWDEYEAAKLTGVSGIPTQYTDIDKITLGRNKKDLVIIAARPGHGKSTYALNEAYHLCKQHPVIFFSLEMPTVQLLKKVVSFDTQIPLEAIRTGTATYAQEQSMEGTVRELIMLEGKFIVYDITSLHINDLISIVRMRKRTQNIEVVYVDYLQLMQGHREKGSNRDQEIGTITRGLKKLAMEEDVCVVAMSQLNRESDNRADKRPQLSDLRESGNIEQDADIAQLLFRPEMYGIEYIRINGKDTPTEGILEVTIPKNRNGKVGIGYLTFKGMTSTVSNYYGEPF